MINLLLFKIFKFCKMLKSNWILLRSRFRKIQKQICFCTFWNWHRAIYYFFLFKTFLHHLERANPNSLQADNFMERVKNFSQEDGGQLLNFLTEIIERCTLSFIGILIIFEIMTKLSGDKFYYWKLHRKQKKISKGAIKFF